MKSTRALKLIWKYYIKFIDKNKLFLPQIVPEYNQKENSEPQKTVITIEKAIRYLRENPDSVVHFVKKKDAPCLYLNKATEKYFESEYVIFKTISEPYTLKPIVYVYMNKKF